MAVAVSSYSPYMYHQQAYYYPSVPSFYYSQPAPASYYPPQEQQPKTVEYVDAGTQALRPRRAPRVYRQVIVLPTPEPIYRQVRHRLATPERQVIQRTVVHKNNGEVLVQQQQHEKKPRSQSRSQPSTQSRASRSRQIYTD